jgi:integrase
MRRGDILNLCWHQVDFNAREIRVEKTKSGRSRIVDINSILYEELRKLGNGSPNGQYIFPNPKTGKPYKKLQTSFTGAFSRAGIVGLRMHDLRHTIATCLVLRAGCHWFESSTAHQIHSPLSRGNTVYPVCFPFSPKTIISAHIN